MGIVTAQELKDYINGPALRDIDTQSLPWQAIGRTRENALTCSVTQLQAQSLLDSLEESIILGYFPVWKALRPWRIVDLTAGLGPDKAWIGWEVETSWDTSQDRGNVIKSFFDSYKHVAVDEEGQGSGGYGLEMTWSPANDGRQEGQHPLLFVAEIAKTNNALEHNPSDMVGTHINISTPSLRKLSNDGLHEVANALNLALHEIVSTPVCEEIFGRYELYGGFFARNSYLEGKLFNTTYDDQQARHYIYVGDGLAKVVEKLAAFYIERGVRQYRLRVGGLDDYLLGDGAALTIWEDYDALRVDPDLVEGAPYYEDSEEEY